MKKPTLNTNGFGFIGVLAVVLVIAVAGLSGWLVWHKNHDSKKTTTNTSASSKGTSAKTATDPYEGWKTYKLASKGLSLRYPADWTVPTDGEDSTGIEIHSPAKSGYYFSLALLSGTGDQVNQNFLGSATASTVLELAVPGSDSPLYVDAQTSGNNTNGLGLATTAGGEDASFGILDEGGKGDDNVTMVASLIPEGSSSGVNNAYPLHTYESQADYQTLLTIFKSLSYKN